MSTEMGWLWSFWDRVTSTDILRLLVYLFIGREFRLRHLKYRDEYGTLFVYYPSLPVLCSWTGMMSRGFWRFARKKRSTLMCIDH